MCHANFHREIERGEGLAETNANAHFGGGFGVPQLSPPAISALTTQIKGVEVHPLNSGGGVSETTGSIVLLSPTPLP